jgi:hypothetical protein
MISIFLKVLGLKRYWSLNDNNLQPNSMLELHSAHYHLRMWSRKLIPRRLLITDDSLMENHWKHNPNVSISFYESYKKLIFKEYCFFFNAPTYSISEYCFW